jgi:IS5 family transposase
MRFVGLALHDAVPDAKTIWLFREQLTRRGTLARLFERFDRLLHERGDLAMGGQIIDATIIEARRPRLTREEKTVLRTGGMPAGWSKARTRQIDRDGRWTVGIDRAHGFVRRFAVTHAARHDGSQLAAVLDGGNTASDVWADTAYRSQTNLALLQKRGLVAQFQRAKPRGRPMPSHIARGNATRARVRSRVEHVSCAPSVWPGRRPRSRSPTWPIISLASPGSKGDGRPRDRECCDLGPADLSARPPRRQQTSLPPSSAALTAGNSNCPTGWRRVSRPIRARLPFSNICGRRASRPRW